MEHLASFTVGKPLNILGVAVVFVVAHLLLQYAGVGSGRHPRALLVAAAAWALFAAWEWLVLVRTPEADIRVDLLVIWPLILIATIWFTIEAFR